MVVQERNLQEIFLNTCRKEKMLVTVFLVSGIKLQGKISWFDTYCIALQREGHVQLVYKHGISTIVPMQKMQLKPAEGAATAS
ncbi:MAG: RNA chaperone Hfq [Alphaproteobacteria bacterium]|nr:RNA chaperone Hfq [Alphaproteobacteria bacterium]